MYAVIKAGGKQYRVDPGKEIKVEKLPGEVGASISFDQVIMTSDDGNVKVGKPFLDDTRVTGRITRQGKNKKILVFKYKRRKGYRKKIGHRQQFTQVVIDEIAI